MKNQTMTEASRLETINRDQITDTMKKYKLVVLGNSNVGKTTLTYKLCEDKFLDNVEATVGVDFRSYVVNIGGENIKLEIWDTAGEERFRRSLSSMYYRNADAIIFVYDVTNPQSFNDLKIWIEETVRHQLVDVPKILIANKCDLPAAVNRNLAQCFADANGMLHFETSSRSDSDCNNVRAIFFTIAQKLKDRKPLAAPKDSVITHSMLRQTQDSTSDNSWCSCII